MDLNDNGSETKVAKIHAWVEMKTEQSRKDSDVFRTPSAISLELINFLDLSIHESRQGSRLSPLVTRGNFPSYRLQ